MNHHWPRPLDGEQYWPRWRKKSGQSASVMFARSRGKPPLCAGRWPELVTVPVVMRSYRPAVVGERRLGRCVYCYCRLNFVSCWRLDFFRGGDAPCFDGDSPTSLYTRLHSLVFLSLLMLNRCGGCVSAAARRNIPDQ